eukprot:1158209-Pelagomonas_calceolata.AAC.12
MLEEKRVSVWRYKDAYMDAYRGVMYPSYRKRGSVYEGYARKGFQAPRGTALDLQSERFWL